MSIKKVIQLAGLFSLLLGGLIMFSQPAAAAENMWMRWEIEADLTIGEPDVNLIVETGYYDEQGTWRVDKQQTIPLACEVNNVEFEEGGPAIFAGDGYIACEMIDVVQVATKMAGGEVDFPEEMGGSGTVVTAEVTLEGYGSDNPVFYHPDILFHAANVGEAYLGLEVGGLAAKSSFFMPEPQQKLHGALGQSGDPKVHFPEFMVDGQSLSSDPAILYGPALVSNVYEGVIYFGYSPVTDTYFTGEIYSIDVDPGCVGMG